MRYEQLMGWQEAYFLAEILTEYTEVCAVLHSYTGR